MSEITKEQLVEELLKKKKCEYEWRKKRQNSIWEFCREHDPEFFIEEKDYLADLCNNLQLLAETNDLLPGIEKRESVHPILKMMINMPPQCGKSYTVSVFCAWLLGNNPTGSIMRNSYGAKLAEKFSSDVQSIVKGKAFKKVFGKEIYLDPKKTAKDAWSLNTAKDFSYICAGVGGGSTGFGCNLLLIGDDFVRGVKEALSTTALDNIYMWYKSEHRTRARKIPPTPELHICTRWAKKDPAGRILQEEMGQWIEFSYSALIKDDEGKYKTFSKYYESTEKLMSMWESYELSGLEFLFLAVYMQQGVEKGGLLFPEKKLKTIRRCDLPKFDYKIGWCDVADEGGDSLCSPIAGVCGEDAYIIDIIHTTASSETTESLVANQIKGQKPSEHTFESNSGGKIFARNVKAKLSDNLKHIVKWKRSTSNKETRIILSAPAIIKNFYFLHEDDRDFEYRKYFSELTDYVKGKKNQRDDAPDATAALSQQLFASSEVIAGIIGA